MLAIVTGIISALGRYNHYFDMEVSGFVELYGEQILRSFKWNIGDSITFALLEEIKLVVNLFQSIALSAPSSASENSVVVQEPLDVCEAVLTVRKNLEGVLIPTIGPTGAVEEESMSFDGQRLDGLKAERRAPRDDVGRAVEAGDDGRDGY
ncbi:hypothetical protein C0995_007290 [Termitomyces sp. Mi166|nr:hypothetical protein C0995_007290 [Termitomyces sp. Mi166\